MQNVNLFPASHAQWTFWVFPDPVAFPSPFRLSLLKVPIALAKRAPRLANTLDQFARGFYVTSVCLLVLFSSIGISNGPIQFESARNIWPLLELLAKIRRVASLLVVVKFLQVLACSDFSLPCSLRIIYILETKTDTGNNFFPYGKLGNMRALWMFLEKCFLFLLTFIETDRPSSVQSSRVTLPETLRL